jgi:hypothetical protein
MRPLYTPGSRSSVKIGPSVISDHRALDGRTEVSATLQSHKVDREDTSKVATL